LRLRAIAARVEALPLESAAEVLVLLEPALAVFEQQAARAGADRRAVSDHGSRSRSRSRLLRDDDATITRRRVTRIAGTNRGDQSRKGTRTGYFALRPYHPPARRVYQPAAVPERASMIRAI